MLTIHVRFLSGKRVAFKVRPETQLYELEEHCELGLDRFSEIRLSAGCEELRGKSTIADAGLSHESEVQAVVMPSRSKVMQYLRLNVGSHFTTDDVNVLAALEMIGQVVEITPDDCRTLWAKYILASIIKGSVVFALGAAFGRACSKLGNLLPTFVELPLKQLVSGRIPYQTFFAVAALANIASWNSEALPKGVMVQWALTWVSFDWVPSWTSRSCGPDWHSRESTRDFLRAAIRLIGIYGKTPTLQRLAQGIHPLRETFTNESDFAACQQAADEACAEMASRVEVAAADASEAGPVGAASGGAVALIGGDALRAVELELEDEEVNEDKVKLDEALQQSELEALHQEQEQLHEVILRSKADGPQPISSDDVVIFRLTRFSKQIQDVLRSSPCLANCRQRVEASGCEVVPVFSDSTFFVPITEEQYKELQLTLQPHHIVAWRGDQAAIVEALRAVPASKRPKMRFDHRAHEVEGVAEEPMSPCTSQKSPTAYADTDHCLYVVEESVVEGPLVHGFFHFNIRDVSEVSSDLVCHSAPCGDATSSTHCQPVNARRYVLHSP